MSGKSSVPLFGTNQPDSTCSTTEAGLLESIEKLIEKKFKIIETRFGLLEQKHDVFCLDHEKVLPLLHKIQRHVDDLTDQHEVETRKIKDEIYSVQDSIISVGEKLSDLKADTRELLHNSDSMLDKVQSTTDLVNKFVV